jgi:RNA polymerase sigma-70 factor (ECF subfamily)
MFKERFVNLRHCSDGPVVQFPSNRSNFHESSRNKEARPRQKIHAQIELELPGLRRYAMALLRNPVDSDDLVQETVARALDKIHLWDPETNLRAWLFTIMHNLRVNGVRRAVREGSHVSLEAAFDLGTEPQQGWRLGLRDLERALGQLDEGHRAALLLIGLEGLRYEEAAAVLEVPLGTVRSRLSRARTRLKQMLAGEITRSANNKASATVAARDREMTHK